MLSALDSGKIAKRLCHQTTCMQRTFGEIWIKVYAGMWVPLQVSKTLCHLCYIWEYPHLPPNPGRQASVKFVAIEPRAESVTWVNLHSKWEMFCSSMNSIQEKLILFLPETNKVPNTLPVFHNVATSNWKEDSRSEVYMIPYNMGGK